MWAGDSYENGSRHWFRLFEKGGKHHEVPVYHKAQGLCARVSRESRLSAEWAMSRSEAYRMIRRRAIDAGVSAPVSCHSFRATGITVYLKNKGMLETAQKIAAHESPRTTKTNLLLMKLRRSRV
jgi:integrase/recombinase XerD